MRQAECIILGFNLLHRFAVLPVHNALYLSPAPSPEYHFPDQIQNYLSESRSAPDLPTSHSVQKNLDSNQDLSPDRIP